MAEIFLKGSAYSIPFLVKSGKTTITNENVASVRLGLGNLTASWPGGRLRYSGGYWLFPVTQAQSYALPQGETYYQAQIQMASGETFSSKRQCIFVDGTIFRTPFGETQLATPETADAQPIPAQIEPKPEQIAVEIQTVGGGLPSSYVLPPATSDKLGGVKADPATEQDTVPVRIGEDEKLYAENQLPTVTEEDNGKVLGVVDGKIGLVSGGGTIYEGPYEVSPIFDDPTALPTDGKLMAQDVTVNPIAVSRTSNTSGGQTIFIGGITNG